MKSVLMSIQPKWCELIASGKKTIEVRKTKPKLETPFKVYIYATKSGDRLVLKSDKVFEISRAITGKVIGEFVCERISEPPYLSNIVTLYGTRNTYAPFSDELNASCLTIGELNNYGKGNSIYFWHISNLVIYDKPKELNNFYKPTLPTFLRYEDDVIKRPPQSWCYVESESE